MECFDVSGMTFIGYAAETEAQGLLTCTKLASTLSELADDCGNDGGLMVSPRCEKVSEAVDGASMPHAVMFSSHEECSSFATLLSSIFTENPQFDEPPALICPFGASVLSTLEGCPKATEAINHLLQAKGDGSFGKCSFTTPTTSPTTSTTDTTTPTTTQTTTVTTTPAELSLSCLKEEGSAEMYWVNAGSPLSCDIAANTVSLLATSCRSDDTLRASFVCRSPTAVSEDASGDDTSGDDTSGDDTSGDDSSDTSGQDSNNSDTNQELVLASDGELSCADAAISLNAGVKRFSTRAIIEFRCNNHGELQVFADTLEECSNGLSDVTHTLSAVIDGSFADCALTTATSTPTSTPTSTETSSTTITTSPTSTITTSPTTTAFESLLQCFYHPTYAGAYLALPVCCRRR